MPSDDVKLIDAMSDQRGLTIAVYQDHGGVRVDAAGGEIMLSAEAADKLSTLLIDAAITADLWTRAHA